MTLEMVIFIIVATVAIFSAAMMLVSRNAVHSAMFLVVNFACVAFFYLLLNAPFLAMIQITVYAGAIMVLFMFVIMLLGADKLGTEQAHYPRLAYWAVALTVVFLAVAYVAIVNGNVGILKSVPPAPEARFIHTVVGAPAVDVYVGTDKVADSLAYGEATDFAAVRAGDFILRVYPTCTEADKSKCVDPIKANASPIATGLIKLAPDTATVYIVAGKPDALKLITVPFNLGTLEDEHSVRLTVVNTLPGDQPVTLIKVNPSANKLNAPDLDNKIDYEVVAPALTFGSVTPEVIWPEGTYDLVWQRGNERVLAVSDWRVRGKTHELLILGAEPTGTGATRPAWIKVDAPRTDEAFGSPQAIGQTMLGAFLLPFELVSLLLLAAMVGAIILTREEVTRRVRQRLVVSPVVQRMNSQMASNITTSQPTKSETSAD